MVLNIDPAAWLELGLEFVGFDKRRQKIRHKANLDRFETHFGASPETHSAIWLDLQTTAIPEACIARPDPMHTTVVCTRRPQTRSEGPDGRGPLPNDSSRPT